MIQALQPRRPLAVTTNTMIRLDGMPRFLRKPLLRLGQERCLTTVRREDCVENDQIDVEYGPQIQQHPCDRGQGQRPDVKAGLHILGAGSLGLLWAARLRLADPSIPVHLLLRDRHAPHLLQPLSSSAHRRIAKVRRRNRSNEIASFQEEEETGFFPREHSEARLLVSPLDPQADDRNGGEQQHVQNEDQEARYPSTISLHQDQDDHLDHHQAEQQQQQLQQQPQPQQQEDDEETSSVLPSARPWPPRFPTGSYVSVCLESTVALSTLPPPMSAMPRTTSQKTRRRMQWVQIPASVISTWMDAAHDQAGPASSNASKVIVGDHTTTHGKIKDEQEHVSEQRTPPNRTSNRKIVNLLVTTKAWQAVSAITSLLPKLDPDDAHIILLCNGALAVADELQQVWDTLPSTSASSSTPRRQIHMAWTSHGAYRPIAAASSPSRNDDHTKTLTPFMVVQAGLGQTRLFQYPAMAEWWTRAGLVCQSVSDPREMQRDLWYKLAANTVINPLTALLSCRNGELMRPAGDPDHDRIQLGGLEATNGSVPSSEFLADWPTIDSSPVAFSSVDDLMHAILQEVSQVAQAVTNGAPVSPTPAAVSISSSTPGESDHPYSISRLVEFVRQVIHDTANNKSSMLQDVMAGRRTEIDYLNGYVVRQGVQYGLRCAVNEELCRRVHALHPL